MPPIQPPSSQALFAAAIVALIAWRMYARIRRNIGRQRLSPVRPWVTVTLFPLLVALLALSTRALPVAEACLAAGAAVGIGLGVLGLRLTRFEQSPEGLYYTSGSSSRRCSSAASRIASPPAGFRVRRSTRHRPRRTR